ncbi:PREDICTED: probable receptor-like protein kinase At4g39110 [Camelina sativa]|uniref:Probable receptor-like protein kinase At4g39110 n=1 Tax=Camelina sativa TaxID=90675 RepID=A0ABM1QBK4_CAMSA|nr:PREDICTED: probable receptor-like protein kinase At4g39110 [Camelina sativa]
MSWDFPVSAGYKYLIRMHFCDIASKSLGRLYFNVFINGNVAYQDFDISYAADDVLASPYYIDFVVDPTTADYNNNKNSPSGSSITVSVGPSNKTSVDEHGVDAILNGVEIMKMNNSMGSLDGYVSADMILNTCPNRRNVSIFIAMLAFMCIFMSFYIVARRKKARDNYGWTKLSMDGLEDNNPKSGNQLIARKA